MIPDKYLKECISCNECYLDPDCWDANEPHPNELICYHHGWLGDYKHIFEIRTEKKDKCPLYKEKTQ